MLLNFSEQQSHLNSDNRKTRLSDDAYKNQSFRVLKLYSTKVYGSNTKRTPNYDVSQQSTSMPLSQKNMLSFTQYQSGDEFKRSHLSCEQLASELKQQKQSVNGLKDDNLRLRTKVQQNEKQLNKYESLIEELAVTNKKQGGDVQVFQLRKQLKDKQNELQDKIREVEQLKRNVKVCKMQELEIEKKVYFEQTLKMKHLLVQAQDQIYYQQNKLNMVTKLEDELLQMHITINKLEDRNRTKDQQIDVCDQTIKQLKTNLRTLSQASALINEKNAQLMQKLKHQQSQLNALQVKRKSNSINEQSSHIEIVQPSQSLQMLLLSKNITQEQLQSIFKQLQRVGNNKQQFIDILLKEPILLSKEEAQVLVDKLGSNLYQNLTQQLASYHSLENLKLEESRKIIQQQINNRYTDVRKYWEQIKLNQISNSEITLFLERFKFNWNQDQQLHYLLEVYLSSGYKLEQVSLDSLLNPFKSENSFLRDLKDDSPTEQFEDYSNKDVVISQFFQVDVDDVKVEQQIPIPENKLAKYQSADYQIQEASDEDEEVDQQIEALVDNINDIALCEMDEQSVPTDQILKFE